MNDIELRLSLLFKSINIHFDKYKEPEPKTEVRVGENGKRIYTYTLDGGDTSRTEKIDASNRINLIIHNLANLKDNLKNHLRDNNLAKEDWEKINNGETVEITRVKTETIKLNDTLPETVNVQKRKLTLDANGLFFLPFFSSSL